jgi:hypothetical protein
VVEGRMDWFKASEELYRLWREASPEVRGELEAALNQLNRLYGEKYGVTLEPWRPSLLETALRRAELFASDVRAAVENVLRSIEGFRQRREMRRDVELQEEYIDIINKFRTGELGLEEAKGRLLELAKRAEKADKELADWFRKKAGELGKERVEEKPPQIEKQPEVRLPDERDVEFIKRAEEERRRLELELKERESGRGRQQLLLLEKEPKVLLDREVVRVIDRFRRGELTAEEARRRILDAARRAEKFDKALAAFYRSLADAVEKGDLQTLKTLASQLRDVTPKTDVYEVQIYNAGQRPALEVRLKEGALVLEEPKAATELKPETRVLELAEVRQILTPEVRGALIEGLETRQKLGEAEALPGIMLTPEVRQILAQAQEVRRRLAEIDAALKLLLRRKQPKKERRPAIPLMPPILQTEPPQYVEPSTNALEPFGDISKYNPPLLTTATPPPTYTVTTPTYTPATVPKISEVPTVDVPTVPTPDTVPVPPPLPPGWWRLLPPDAVAENSREGAYKVQTGKKQILALA